MKNYILKNLNTKLNQDNLFIVRLIENICNKDFKFELWWDSLPETIFKFREDIFGNDTSYTDILSFQDSGVFVGCTTNPRLVYEGVMLNKAKYANIIKDLKQKYTNELQIYKELYKSIFKDNALHLYPLWESSNGKYGFICAQVPPYIKFSDEIVEYGLELSKIAPNMMIKVMSNKEGCVAIRSLVSHGVCINTTTSFTVPQFAKCLEALKSGYNDAKKNNVDLSRWRSVMTYMIGRLGSEKEFLDQANELGITLTMDEIRWAELLIFYKCFDILKKEDLPIKIILCSLKMDKFLDVKSCMHIEKTLGHNIVYTLNPKFISELIFSERGTDDFEMPTDLLDKLLKIPYFRRAYQVDGLDEDEFCFHPAFQRNALELCDAYDKTLNFIREGK